MDNGTKFWYLNNKIYSEGEYNQKIQEMNKSKVIKKEYENRFVYEDSDGNIHREDGPAIEFFDGTKKWFKRGVVHREDGPAIELDNGTKSWYKEGKLHREDGPAVEYSNGTKEWFINGELHREDGPAVEEPSGNKEWWIKGYRHREDGPAIEWKDGTKKWYKKGNLHREDGPAIEWYNGTKSWWINDELHREDGPAIEWHNGAKEWRINGRLHRQDGPALISIDQSDSTPKETKTYYIADRYICSDEKTFHRFMNKNHKKIKVKGKNKTSYYVKINGFRLLHSSKDNPSVIFNNGKKCWHSFDQLHRVNGPAVIFSNGDKKWYLFGKEYSYDDFIKKVKELNLVELNSKMKEEKKMANFDIFDTNRLADEFKMAGLRVASDQIVTLVASVLVNAIGDKLPENDSVAVKLYAAAFLKTDFGKAFISAILGNAIPNIPQLKDNVNAQMIASEFRIKGMEIAGNEVASMLLDQIIPGIQNILAENKDMPNFMQPKVTPQLNNQKVTDVEAEPIKEKKKIGLDAVK